MKRRTNRYNPKRKLQPPEYWSERERKRRSKEASYGGNPEHKSSPGDYGLSPPCSPRPGKTLCDKGREFPKERAEQLLRAGLERGMISRQVNGSWPQNVWAISQDGEVFEGQLENRAIGAYHGYPMPEDDDFRTTVIEEWNRRGQ